MLIVLGYLALASLYATRTPPWQVPDEPAHYNYIAQVARSGCCPVIAPGDWDNAYLDRIKAERFAPAVLAGRLDSVQYEDHQPPLYYLLASLVFRLRDGDLIALRLFSVVLGAGVVILAWAVARQVAPSQPWLGVGAAAFVAFLPQHLAMMGGVNNDALAEVVAGLILLVCVRHVRGKGGRWSLLTLAGLLGVAFWTKLTVYPFAGVVLVALALRGRHEALPLRLLGRQIVLVFGVAVLIAAPFWLRNVRTYGGADFLAQAAHDRVVVGQVQTGEYVAQNGVGGWLVDAVQVTFQSFWGQFGWMGVPMSATIYSALANLTLFALLGAGLRLTRRRHTWTATQHHLVWMLAAALILVFAAHVYYNLRFVQFQGRYLYPALIPLALLFVSGLGEWADLVTQITSGRLRLLRKWLVPGVIVLVSAAMAGFALYALFRILLPALVW